MAQGLKMNEIDRDWFEMHKKSKDFFEKYGFSLVRADFDYPFSAQIAFWQDTQRALFKDHLLNQKHIKLLSQFDFVTEKTNDDEIFAAYLWRYLQFQISPDEVTKKTRAECFRWASVQRRLLSDKKMLKWRVNALKKSTFPVKRAEKIIEREEKDSEMLEECKLMKQRSKIGKLAVISGAVKSENLTELEIKRFLVRVRQKERNGTIKKSLKKELDTLGFIWNPTSEEIFFWKKLEDVLSNFVNKTGKVDLKIKTTSGKVTDFGKSVPFSRWIKVIKKLAAEKLLETHGCAHLIKLGLLEKVDFTDIEKSFIKKQASKYKG